MRDFIENLEAGAEDQYYEMLQEDGRLKCGCGKLFNSLDGGMVSQNPYAMPVCPSCFDEWLEKMITSGSTGPREQCD